MINQSHPNKPKTPKKKFSFDVLDASESQSLVPSRTTPLKKIKPKGLRDAIARLLKMKGAHRIIAWLINTLVTHRRVVLLLSHPITQKGVGSDSNQRFPSCDWATFSQFLAICTANNAILTCLRPPTKFGSGVQKAGVYRLTHPGIRAYIMDMIGEEAAAQQEKAALEFYDGFESEEQRVEKESVKKQSDIANAAFQLWDWIENKSPAQCTTLEISRDFNQRFSLDLKGKALDLLYRGGIVEPVSATGGSTEDTWVLRTPFPKTANEAVEVVMELSFRTNQSEAAEAGGQTTATQEMEPVGL